MKQYILSWERRVASVKKWEPASINFNWGVTVLEIQSMAAGLRAEVRNIRNVKVTEISEVSKVLS